LKIVAGDNNAIKKEPEEQHVQICKIYIHPKYDTNAKDHDIALVKLCNHLTFTPYVRPILLPSKRFVVPNSACVTAAGWGDTETGGAQPSILQKVYLKYFNHLACKEKFGFQFTNRHICTGVVKGGKGTCQGDSGGPLWYKPDEKPYLVGITSFGVGGCARPKLPAVFTNVVHYRTWIGEVMKRRENTLYQLLFNSSSQTSFYSLRIKEHQFVVGHNF
jgi:secreted trypsin-like serine protease